MKTPTAESFLKYVELFEMNINNATDGNCNIEFRNPNNSDRNFSLTTWKNHLCISGDMGCYVFKHYSVEAMFRLFRMDALETNVYYLASIFS